MGFLFSAGDEELGKKREKLRAEIIKREYIERERYTCVLLKGFEAESFPLKYQHPTFEYKIHSIEVDLYYFKYL